MIQRRLLKVPLRQARSHLLTSLQTKRSNALLSRPFDETKKLRETSQDFPKPNFISFDLHDSLYAPRFPIEQQYHEIASKEFGIHKSTESIKEDFVRIKAYLQEVYPNYGKNSEDIKDSDEWWLLLIVKLFQVPHFKDDQNSANLCSRLLTHFTGQKAYKLFDDVIPTLEHLRLSDIPLIACSNSDTRIFDIAKNLGISQYFDRIFLSYDLETTKPSKSFYDKVAISMMSSAVTKENKSQYLEKCWHVGDHKEKDYLGAVRSGWNGILLDRTNRYGLLALPLQPSQELYQNSLAEENTDKSNENLQFIANNRIVVGDLHQLSNIFKF